MGAQGPGQTPTRAGSTSLRNGLVPRQGRSSRVIDPQPIFMRFRVPHSGMTDSYSNSGSQSPIRNLESEISNQQTRCTKFLEPVSVRDPGPPPQVLLVEEPRGVERRRDRLEPVAEEANDELVDQAGLLDLGSVAAPGDHDLADLEDLVGRPDRASDVGEHPVVLAPDDQGWVGNLASGAGRRSGRRSPGASGRFPSSTSGPGTCARSTATSSSLAKCGRWKTDLTRVSYWLRRDALHHRQVLVAVDARGADQDEVRDLLGMADGVGQDDLAAEARADEVVGRALDELVEVVGEPFGQVIDRDLAARVDLLVERVAVVNEDLGNLNVEMPRPVGRGWRTSSPTARPAR